MNSFQFGYSVLLSVLAAMLLLFSAVLSSFQKADVWFSFPGVAVKIICKIFVSRFYLFGILSRF